MKQTPTPLISRRDFLQHTGRLATVSALAGVTIPYVHAAGSDLIQVALVGCGGRGTGAAGQALSTTSGPIWSGLSPNPSRCPTSSNGII